MKDLSEFDEGFIKSYNEKCKEGYFPEVDIQYPKNLNDVQNDLPFFTRKNEYWKCWKTCC